MVKEITALLLAQLVLFSGCRRHGPPPGGKKAETAVRQQKSQVGKAEVEELTPEALKTQEITVAEQCLRDFPQDPMALFLMGKVLNRHGKTHQAEAFWKRGLALYPTRPDAYNAMAWIAIERAQYKEALKLWDKVLSLAPRFPEAHAGKARAYMGLGKVKEAAAELETQIALFPDNAFNHFLLGQQYFQLGQFKKARACYLEAVKRDPNLTNAFYGLLQVSVRLGDRAKAMEYRKTFKKLKERDKQELKDRDLAYRDFEKLKKNASKTYTETGQLYLLKDRTAQAKEFLLRACDLDPENCVARKTLASVLKKQGALPEAAQLLRQVIQRSPKDYVAYQELVGVLLAQRTTGAVTEAEKVLKDAAAALPDRDDLYRQLAAFLLSFRKSAQEARKVAERAVELRACAPNYDVLSWACYAAGDLQAALSAIEKAIALAPENPVYRKRRAQLLERK